MASWGGGSTEWFLVGSLGLLQGQNPPAKSKSTSQEIVVSASAIGNH